MWLSISAVSETPIASGDTGDAPPYSGPTINAGVTAQVMFSYGGTEPVTKIITWLAAGVPISGAIGVTMVVPNDAIGKILTARVTLTNDYGTVQQTSAGLLVV